MLYIYSFKFTSTFVLFSSVIFSFHLFISIIYHFNSILFLLWLLYFIVLYTLCICFILLYFTFSILFYFCFLLLPSYWISSYSLYFILFPSILFHSILRFLLYFILFHSIFLPYMPIWSILILTFSLPSRLSSHRCLKVTLSNLSRTTFTCRRRSNASRQLRF